MIGEYATGDVGTTFDQITKRSRRMSDRTWPGRTGSGDTSDTRHRGRPQNVTKTPKQPGSQEVRWDAMQSQPSSCAMPGVILPTDNTPQRIPTVTHKKDNPYYTQTQPSKRLHSAAATDSGLKAVSTLIVTVTVAVDVKQRSMRAVVKRSLAGWFQRTQTLAAHTYDARLEHTPRFHGQTDRDRGQRLIAAPPQGKGSVAWPENQPRAASQCSTAWRRNITSCIPVTPTQRTQTRKHNNGWSEMWDAQGREPGIGETASNPTALR
ncbi:hypothetical protein CMUS01_05561 [Colletotrichum musicola]|uniref:Uncharacterized protein n=1 Tax=Colletotrichum musicola TaxID=2175873 RepID=A0A8H6KRT1_9PEZI|nr:hypothetical protein CMUS01_05561 [Colletotrichum musicola]